MGQAKQRGTFEKRKSAAIAHGKKKRKVEARPSTKHTALTVALAMMLGHDTTRRKK